MVDTVGDVLLKIVRGNHTSDMSVRQLCILYVINEGRRTVRDLAEVTALGKPAISRAGDRLEAMGFAQRFDDPDDRRSILLGITSAGKRFLTNLRTI